MSALYIIICKTLINGEWQTYHREQELGDYTSRRDVVQGIVRGQIEDPFEIIEVILDERVVEPITKEIARSVRDQLDGPCPDRLRDFLESNLSGLARVAA